MASKLEYLQKYLAKPAEAKTDEAKPKKQHGDGKKSVYMDEGAFGTQKKKRKKQHGDTSMTGSMQIRDMSEVLPKAREAGMPQFVGHQAKLLSMNLDEDEERLARDGELGFVEEDDVIEAAKMVAKDVEKSGVGWSMKNHQKPSKQALRTAGGSARKIEPIKAEIIKEVKDEGSDEDMSPPRAQARTSRAAPPKDGDSDVSPPRGRPTSRNHTVELSPPRAQPRGKVGEDVSPARRPAAAKTMPRKPLEKASDDDLSPPRQAVAASSASKRHDSDGDLSPPRAAAAPAAAKKRHDSDEDLSPPRKAAPEKEVKKESKSDDDMSPPRKAAPKAAAAQRTRHDSDSDLSPPRKEPAQKDVKKEPDAKVAPQRTRHDSDSDLSPPRASGAARHDSDDDLSPPRKGEEEEAEKMSSGLRAGLVSGIALREETAKVREERKAALAAAPDHETGKNADTVYRSRAGGKVDREEWVQQQQKKRKKKLSEYPEQELAWGGGVKQQANAEDEMAEATRVSQLPFARFEPEADAVKEFMDRQSWNDPMAKYQDEEDAVVAAPLGPARPDPSSAAAPEPPKPKCPHPAWPNRFDILPGYRWDGRVRGNLYEKRWLQARNDRQFMKTERYRYERLED